MVGLNYFFDHEKHVHRINILEQRMSRYATIKGVEIAFVLGLILVFSSLLEGEESTTFVYCAIYGLLTFLAVEVRESRLRGTFRKPRIDRYLGPRGAR